ncbi:rhomboid family intramembrane serine protease [Terrilactibacillus sp. BCM23-1]|uniref:Rhomboid family intramembrane serine protease n=1 Tax=Terrilactibacillus tamarindi TaxID=2599694 RepID=A0A6N8CWP5_9BACI|nr:rhomboid family intramembrane serine protease [Terrilactibacillus tamarindi]MTT33146.1 rhomboid family intramembrane serine protease [Terrilactibacillus tamarindi]
MFLRTENFKTFIRRYPVVSLFLFIMILVYLLVFFDYFLNRYIGLNTGLGDLIIRFGLGVNASISQGDWWLLITPIFLHITFSHILFNAFSLYIFGPGLEYILGKWKFAIAFIGSGLISNIASFFIENQNFAHLGASSALFGLFGLYLYLILYRKELVSSQDRTIIVIIMIISLLSSFIYPNIDILGHLFGFLGGLILAPIVFIKKAR